MNNRVLTIHKCNELFCFVRDVSRIFVLRGFDKQFAYTICHLCRADRLGTIEFMVLFFKWYCV